MKLSTCQPFASGLRLLLSAVLALAWIKPGMAAAEPSALTLVAGIEAQPLMAQVHRLVTALDDLGEPLAKQDRLLLETAFQQADPRKDVETVQRVLDRYCLLEVDINPEVRVHVKRGPGRPELLQAGWRQFLVKVRNEAGTTAELRVFSPEAQAVYSSDNPSLNDQVVKTPSDQRFKGSNAASLPVASRWMDLQMYSRQPMAAGLSGLTLEYRIVQIYSRDAGQREATLSVDVGQGTQDFGFKSEIPLLFNCAAASAVTLRVLDEDGQPTIAAFVVRDRQGRVYPSQAKRLAPDFDFQPQVYRGDGDVLALPVGTYAVQFSRGPESRVKNRTLVVSGTPQEASFQVERWIDPSKSGWWSGDHHIHAAGCMHYTKPTEGVFPADMLRHLIGEDLKIGSVLTWGPCFDFQKQFFCGAVDPSSRYPYLMRYDIEVSGFGSHNSGHLDLLRLRDQHYPGTRSTDGWPSLCLETMRWAKAQGAVVGFAHSGWGLTVKDPTLPTYEVPKFDSIGAMEYIVDVTHELPGPDRRMQPAVDFISTGDTPPAFELNIWYHTLNAGFRTRIAGETDFPCIYGERVGIGRSYVKLAGRLNYDDWCEGIRQGRSYTSDGQSHLMDFKANTVSVGENGSELKLANPDAITLTVTAAALLGDTPVPGLHGLGTISGPGAEDWRKGNLWSDADRPFWSLERARIGASNEVPVEVIVNGFPVATEKLVADGKIRDLTFHVNIARSSWVALRILGSSHTNPIFVLVGDKPVRASRRSLEWCLKCVDQCWSQKAQFIRAEEMEAAKAAYEHARQTYRQRLQECGS